ncbi:MAG: hypothetical protein ACP5QT_06315 [Brevinematia bacterium]
MYSFFSGLVGLIFFVGGGSFWFYHNLMKRKRLLKNLLSLPKGRRFFWYKLRKNGFRVKDINVTRRLKVCINGKEDVSFLKLDFLVKKDGKSYGGLFAPDVIEKKEMIKLYFVYSAIFNLKGVLFYNEVTRSFVKIER